MGIITVLYNHGIWFEVIYHFLPKAFWLQLQSLFYFDHGFVYNFLFQFSLFSIINLLPLDILLLFVFCLSTVMVFGCDFVLVLNQNFNFVFACTLSLTLNFCNKLSSPKFKKNDHRIPPWGQPLWNFLVIFVPAYFDYICIFSTI